LHQSFSFGQRCQWWEAPCSTLHIAKFDCPGGEGVYENEVEIMETGQRATSAVNVECESDIGE
jgi:hypothetical protein